MERGYITCLRLCPITKCQGATASLPKHVWLAAGVGARGGPLISLETVALFHPLLKGNGGWQDSLVMTSCHQGLGLGQLETSLVQVVQEV